MTEPGWKVREGQAIWHLPKGTAEIAGEVLLATRPDGHALVQFAKSPFPLVVGQVTATCWKVEFPPQDKHYAGRGTPPKRISWLYLARALSGKSLPKNWTWKEDSSGWRLENRANGEVIEGYFN